MKKEKSMTKSDCVPAKNTSYKEVYGKWYNSCLRCDKIQKKHKVKSLIILKVLFYAFKQSNTPCSPCSSDCSPLPLAARADWFPVREQIRVFAILKQRINI